jgi:opacity protein-like surface antigen
MQNKLYNIFSICALSVFISEVQATEQKTFFDNLYAEVFGGVAMPKKLTGQQFKGYPRPKNKFTYGLGLGYKLTNNFRAELSVQSLDISSTETTSNKNPTSINYKFKNLVTFGNLSYDITSFSHTTPYLTAGAGFNHFKVNHNFTLLPAKKLDSSTKFAWNIGAGIRQSLTDNITLDFKYKYLDLGKTKFASRPAGFMALGGKKSPPIQTKLRAHTFNVGVAYNF